MVKAESRRKICIVSGTRAEYGLLRPLMSRVRQDPGMRLQLVATGMHLSPTFGLTYQAIERDGFAIDEKVDIELTSDAPAAVARSMGLATAGLAKAYERLQPDLIVLLGDRFEILAAAQAALLCKIPVAHLAGGDVTEGAYDDAMRHSITKMSHLHFVFHETSARRIRQLGEDPERIFVVGATGIDAIRETQLLTRAELEAQLDYRWKKRNLLVTFHPATWDAGSPEKQFDELLVALESLKDPELGLLFTLPNADTGGRAIIERIERFVASHPQAKAYPSLGQQRYLSAMALADAVVGNSSSGIYEAPALRKPTVNIGDRQKGRLLAESVIGCEPESAAIAAAIRKALTLDCSRVVHPYGDGHSAERILGHIRACEDLRALVKKRFWDLA